MPLLPAWFFSLGMREAVTLLALGVLVVATAVYLYLTLRNRKD